MNKVILITILASISGIATANRYNNINYGQVVEVEPIYQHVSIPEERQVCDRRRNDNHRYQRNENSAGRAILGGIIGGAIGNRFGKGRGRDASTALGVLIGAGVGASNKHRRYQNRPNCYIETYYNSEERFVGYDVTYEFNGELYQTQMQDHPGDRVRLRVNVDVIE